MLKGGAHLTNLRRLSVGSFTVEEAHPIENPVLISPAAGLRDFKEVRVAEEVAIEVSHGKVLKRERLGVDDGSGPWPVLDLQGNLLAVYEPHKTGVKPTVVLVGPS
jgi:tRNA U55 pseudouridine synthase TruB